MHVLKDDILQMNNMRLPERQSYTPIERLSNKLLFFLNDNILLNLPFLFLERADGEFKLRRGFTIQPNSNCLMIEDVVTTGLSSREAIKVVSDLGANVIGEATIVNRSGGDVDLGIKLISLLKLNIPTNNITY